MDTIHLDAQEYELATFDTFTLDEAMVVYDYAKITLDQVGELEGFHPGLIAAMIHVSIQRAKPELKARDIRERVLRIKVLELEKVFEQISVEDDAVPPVSEPAGSGSSGPTGGTSNNGSEGSPGSIPAVGSGVPGSEMSAASAPGTLAD